jgi:hypothetical protein
MSYPMSLHTHAARKVVGSLGIAPPDTDDVLVSFATALGREVAVRFVYCDQDGVVSIRVAEPIAFRRVEGGKDKGTPYFQCYDVHRDGPRRFRIGNVIALL